MNCETIFQIIARYKVISKEEKYFMNVSNPGVYNYSETFNF
jgi:hypothetical protein